MYYFFFDFENAAKDVHERFVLVDVPIGVSLQQVFNDFYDTTRDQVADRVGVILLLRPTPKHSLSKEKINKICNRERVGKLAKDSWLKILLDAQQSSEFTFARFSDHSVHIIGSENFSHFITDNINPGAHVDKLKNFNIEKIDLLQHVKDAEIDHLLVEGSCYLPSSGSQYYRAPSKNLVRSFIRVGNIQRSRHALDAIFFWLLPHLMDCIGVITDTWSISSLSQNVSRRLTEYRNDGSKPCPVEMLGNYADSAQHVKAAATIDGFIDRLSLPGSRGTVLVLISATQTGSLQKSLNEYLTERGIADRVKYVCILKLGAASDLPCLRDLSGKADFVPVKDPTPEEIETAIDIDSTVYFPIQAQDIEHSNTLAILEEMSHFTSTYGGVPFARVHFTDNKTQSTPRHHMVWIDTISLIETKAFQERLQKQVLSLQPAPSVLVFPDHTAARILAEKVCSLLDGKPKLTCHEDLRITENVSTDRTAREVISDLGKEEAVLLIDDAFITGFRITTYQMNLRKINSNCVLYYLCAISRPEKKLTWERQKKSFIKARGAETPNYKNEFLAVEELILPNWSETKCPWCAEAKLGNKFPKQICRSTILHKSKEGLIDNLFIVRKDHAQPTLQPGSFFGESGMIAANLFCLVSSLLQIMRTEQTKHLPLLGEEHFLISSILNKDVYIKNFTDIIIGCAFLRSALPTELIYRKVEDETNRTDSLYKKFLADDAAMLGELLFSQITGRLPRAGNIDIEKEWAEKS